MAVQPLLKKGESTIDSTVERVVNTVEKAADKVIETVNDEPSQDKKDE